MKRLTHTGQFPAGQSTRRFPRAKSDRQQQSALTYLVSPRHRESPPSENHVSDGRGRGCEKATGPAASPRYLSLVIARSLSSRTPFPLSFSPRSVRRSVGRSVGRSVRPSVRPSVAHSLARFFTRRPTAHSTPGRGERDKQRAFYQTRLRSRHDIRIYAILATSGSRRASRRPRFPLLGQTPATRTEDSSTRAATRSARRAHTTPERVL